MECVIYKIENKVNGKVYIGQTRVGFSARSYAHRRALNKKEHNNDYLQRAWDKYGEENFVFSVIEECAIDELDTKEIKWIAHYKENGGSYNLESGGNKNKIPSEYTRAKVSKGVREAFKRPGTVKRLRELAETRRGKNNNNAKRVICINTGEIFDTCTEAGEHFSFNGRYIGRVCSGDRTTVNGLQFAYYKEGEKYELKSIIPRTKGNHHASRKIICINNGMIFDSVVSAGEYFNINPKNIHQVVLGKNRCTSNEKDELLQFAYYEEGKKYFLKSIDKSKLKTPKKVICLTTNEVFNSTREAAERMNVQQSKISLVCNGKRSYTGKLPDGTKLRWAFYTEHLSN
jgi:group I intron endonuclease